MKKTLMGRRSFLKAAAAATLVLPNIITSKAWGQAARPAPSNRIVMAGIGMGGQGSGDLNEFMSHPEIQVVAACDVRKDARNNCVNRVNQHHGNQDCKGYNDYRDILARDDIDLILCATPDHWHAQIVVDACKAGKDVYCEKPLTLTIAEGRKIVQAARRYGRVAASGSQRVLQDYGRLACAARSGQFGKIVAAHADPGEPPRDCYLPGEPVPDNIDWDMWLGPAPFVPYNPNRCSAAYGMGGRGFRTWSDYSGGMMTDWGGHKFGGVLHGLGLDHTGPVEILPPDGKENKFLTYVFANGVKIIKGDGGRDVRYIGTEGEVRVQRDLKVPPGLRWYSGGAQSNIADFLYCVKTRTTPFQDVEFGHRTATVCHLGNICFKLNRRLKWDPEKEDFIGDSEASRLVDRPRRGPWQI